MRDNAKSKAELLQEVETLRKRVMELEQCKDITEYKRAEEALRESRRRFRSLVEVTSDWVWEVDQNGIYTYASPKIKELLGYEPQEVIGKTPFDFMLPGEAERVDGLFKDIIKSRKAFNCLENTNLHKDGREVVLETRGVPIFDEGGNLLGYRGIDRDITEGKKAEDALRESEEKFRTFMETASDLMHITDKDGNLTYVNDAMAGTLGYSKDEMIGMHLTKVVSKEEAKKNFDRKLQELITTGEIDVESVWLTKDGKEIYGQTKVVAVYDRDGNFTEGRGILRNITEHKRAEDALRESEKRFREIFENTAVGMYRTTPDGQILMANPALVHMLGYSSFEELGERNLEEKGFEPQYERSTFKEEIEREGWIVSSESTWITRDGEKLHVIENARAVRDEDGKTLYYEGTAENITERKKAEEKLKQYRFMVESAHDVIFFKDLKSRYIIANNKTLEAFGLSREQVIGKSDYEIMPDKAEAAKNIEDDKLVFETGKPTKITKHMTGSDGKEHWFQAIKVPQFDGEGNIIGLIGIARDITESKRRETELKLYREKMSHAERLASLGTLSATLAHKLTQPLTAIRLSIENTLADLETTSGLDTVVEDLKDGLSAVSDVVSTIDIFRDFARKSSVELVSEVSLKAVVERIVRLLSESARQARVSLHLKGMDKLPPILSNEKDLEQLFFALVENAIQAADGKKSRRLIVSGDVKDEHIELQFADNCGGIAAENLDKIFEPFFTTRSARERTGLGLCIVEHIVSGAGGKIRVESKAGKGSTFFVTLPVSRDRMS